MSVSVDSGTQGILVIVLSLFLSFGGLYYLYPEYKVGNLTLHIILLIYFGILSQNTEFWYSAHLVYVFSLFIFISIIQFNLKLSELVTGKTLYSYTINVKDVEKDILNRLMYEETKGQISASKAFKFVNGIDRIDLVGQYDYNLIQGYIKFQEPIKLFSGKSEIGNCKSNKFILRNSSYPNCLEECKNMKMCNYIKWNISNKQCNLMSTCTSFNRNENYNNKSLEKIPSNILSDKVHNGEYMMRGNYIISENGVYVLTIESDGSLKFYKNPNKTKYDSIPIENIETDNNQTLAGKYLLINEIGTLIYFNIKDKPIWTSVNSKHSSKTNLILLNRGLLVLYDVLTDDILWTHNSNWRDDYKVEDITKELINESQKKVKKSYNSKTHTTEDIKIIVEHSASIILYDEYNKEMKGNAKLYTSKINNENYIEIFNTNFFDGKYLIR